MIHNTFSTGISPAIYNHKNNSTQMKYRTMTCQLVGQTTNQLRLPALSTAEREKICIKYIKKCPSFNAYE